MKKIVAPMKSMVEDSKIDSYKVLKERMLSQLEIDELTPEQAEVMAKFDLQQHRRNVKYESHTLNADDRKTPQLNGDATTYGVDELTTDIGSIHDLTDTQRAVLLAVATGLTDKEIAKSLNKSERTVRDIKLSARHTIAKHYKDKGKVAGEVDRCME